MVAYDIKALIVPGTSLCIPYSYHGYSTRSQQHLSSFAKRLPARYSFVFGNRKKSDGSRSGLDGGCSKMSQWNCSRSKACVSQTVCGRALKCNRTLTRESLPLRQENLSSHRPAENEEHLALTVGGILNRHSHGHSYLCTYHVTRFDVQLHEATFQYHTEHQNPTIGCKQNSCEDCMLKRSLLSGWPHNTIPKFITPQVWFLIFKIEHGKFFLIYFSPIWLTWDNFRTYITPLIFDLAQWNLVFR